MGRVSLKTIEEARFKEMSEKNGAHDLYWIKCLFDHELVGLGIKNGTLELRKEGEGRVEEILHKRGVYGYSHITKARIYPEDFPEDYWLFVIGPKEFKRSPLKVLCVAPIINSRDIHEHSVLSEIDERLMERMKGKHKSVKGKLIVPSKEDWTGYARIMEKSFEPTVEPPAEFGKDIGDLVFCARVYSGFERYQIERDVSARQKAAEIIKAAQAN